MRKIFLESMLFTHHQLSIILEDTACYASQLLGSWPSEKFFFALSATNGFEKNKYNKKQTIKLRRKKEEKIIIIGNKL